MDRAITGFRRDDDGDWIAELACGHSQHVRHQPPFQQRPWALSEEGRAARVGRTLTCPPCDRAELPAGLRLARAGPEWDERTLPADLRRAHRLVSGTWGRIVLRDGGLRLSIATVPPLDIDLVGSGAAHAIPPDVDHEFQPIGPVRFSIDIFTVERTAANDAEPGGRTRAPSEEAGDPACWAGLLCPECGIVLDGSPHHPGCPRI